MSEELENLNTILDKYNEVIEDSNLKLSNLKELYKFDYDAMLEEKFRLEREVQAIERAKLNPYFARIDFKNSTNYDKCYIGKKGVIDYDNNIVTVDWRAPISSLYYDSNIGECEYEAPEGIIKGDLLLKRQYVIENSELISFNDVDTVSNDELLRPYLSTSMDNRLKNIVSTIQSEQNKIIRESITKNLVIQGVAGSGKTTVALHRIAYLVYNNRDIFKPSDYMVIGPNKFFIDYISNILPDLDVNGVCQKTLEELFDFYIEEKISVNNSLDVITQIDDVASFKVSLDMKKVIDDYFGKLKIIPNDDFKINDILIVENPQIVNTYNSINKKVFNNVNSIINRMILLLEKEILDNFDNISKKFIKNNFSKEKINDIKLNIKSYLKKYFNILNIKSLKIYVNILTELGYDVSKISKGMVNVEDIPSLIYIKFKLKGAREFDNFKHIVIDEAQDYGIFTFYVLKKLFKNSTFSIYGDLAQSLYPYRSIQKWDCLDKIFKKLEIQKLNKSYRTTIEIMDEANKINKYLGLDCAEAVIRHGEKVEYITDNICFLLDNLKNKYNSIAVITKSQEQANNTYEKLKSRYNVNLINSNNLKYNNGINILPSYLSKGLEFDAVIILNKDNYDKNNILDMKLLYVSMTRALHKLYINKKDK